MFIGREKELNILKNKIESDCFEFGLIYGRRRIGKTYLLKQINCFYSTIYFAANEMGLEFNLKQLSDIIAFYFQEPIIFQNYENLFIYLIKKSKKQKIILIIDEFSYLFQNEPEFLSLFQNIIDQYLKSSNLKLILSGSQIGLIEDIISYHKPLYGRVTFKIKLKVFEYNEAALFYPRASLENKIIFYSIFGGLPFYLVKINDQKSAKDNIINLILEEGAIFENEIDFFLMQEVRSNTKYNQILEAIANGETQVNNITSKSKIQHTGTTVKYLDILKSLDIIDKEICFGKKNIKKTLYFIKDQLFRFVFYFLVKNKSQLVIMPKKDFYDNFIAEHLDEYVSLEFEKICKCFLMKKNNKILKEIGRYWGNLLVKNNTLKQNIDLEIDIILKTNENQLIIYECKWSNQKITNKHLEKLKQKGIYLEKIFSQKIYCWGFFAKKEYKVTESTSNYFLYTLQDLYAS